DFAEPAELPSAVRLNATFKSLGVLAGPVVGSLLLLLLGPTWGILANIVFYLPMTLLMLRTPFTGHSRSGFVRRERVSILDTPRGAAHGRQRQGAGGDDRARRPDRGVRRRVAAGGDAELRPGARRRGRGRPRLRRAAVRQRDRGSGGRLPARGHRDPEGRRARCGDRGGDVRTDLADRRDHDQLSDRADRAGDRRRRES